MAPLVAVWKLPREACRLVHWELPNLAQLVGGLFLETPFPKIYRLIIMPKKAIWSNQNHHHAFHKISSAPNRLSPLEATRGACSEWR